jgi:hypothetical protein
MTTRQARRYAGASVVYSLAERVFFLAKKSFTYVLKAYCNAHRDK